VTVPKLVADYELGPPPESIGLGGIRVVPRTLGIASATSSTKHHDQVSPGSSERISGWPSPWK
jgi:hypothetical protein